MNVKYQYLDLEIQKVNNINLALNDAIDSCANYVPDIETKEEAMSALLDFLVIARTQANLLHLAIDGLNKYNKDYILNLSRVPDEHINPFSDNAFKRKQIDFRY